MKEDIGLVWVGNNNLGKQQLIWSGFPDFCWRG